MKLEWKDLATAALVFTLCAAGPRAEAAERLSIDRVAFDAAQERLYVHGRNFGTATPRVWLDELELEVLASSEELIEAALAPVEGTFRLWVEKPAPPRARFFRSDSIDVTLGTAGPPGPEGPAGPAGPAGPQGPPGDPAALVDGSVTTRILADKSVTTDKLADDFAIDASQIVGLLGGDLEFRLPDILDNRVLLEINAPPGFAGEVIVTHGPALEIERVPGFDGQGRPRETPGPSAEFPFVFEYAGPGEQDLEDIRTNGVPTSIAMIVKTLGGVEVFRWHFFDYVLTSIEPTKGGRKRYTLQLRSAPDNVLRIERTEPFPAEISRNPATDTKVEIEGGVVHGPFPVVELDERERTLTMTFDYVEGGEIWDWVVDTAEGRGTHRSLSVIQLDGNVETGRVNFYECFPIRYEQFTGYAQVEKVKERVVIAYGFSEPGR